MLSHESLTPMELRNSPCFVFEIYICMPKLKCVLQRQEPSVLRIIPLRARIIYINVKPHLEKNKIFYLKYYYYIK